MRRTLVLMMGVALSAAACGSDDGGEGTAPPATDVAAATAAPVPTEPPEPTEPPATDPAITDPAATEPPATEPPSTEPPATDPPDVATTEATPVVDAAGLVPLPGAVLDFTGQPVDRPSVVWSLFSGSGGIVVEDIGGPLPPGCHGTSFFDPATFDLLAIDGVALEAYATRGEGGCDGLNMELGAGVLDGDAVEINTDQVIVFDFGALPTDPFDVSTQILDPDGQDGVFRSAGPSERLAVNDLGRPDLTHVIGADVLFELVDGALDPIAEPPPAAGDCGEVDTCLADRFGIDVLDPTDGDPANVLVAGERAGLFTLPEAAGWEVLVRIVNGCGINDHFWVFAAATTDVEYEVTVTDTASGEASSYVNPLGAAAEPVVDTQAFATCP